MLSFVSFRNRSEVADDTKLKQAFAIAVRIGKFCHPVNSWVEYVLGKKETNT